MGIGLIAICQIPLMNVVIEQVHAKNEILQFQILFFEFALNKELSFFNENMFALVSCQL